MQNPNFDFKVPLKDHIAGKLVKRSTIRQWYRPPPEWVLLKGPSLGVAHKEAKKREWDNLMRDME